MNLKKLFLDYCLEKKLETNQSQIEIIKHLQNYYRENFEKSFFSKIFNKKLDKLSFYLVGDVGVGKTMILDFFFSKLKEKKLRYHFNEFMINFHDFRHKKNDDNSITAFVKNLKDKYEII